ncbi:MAG TPA: hypothetical protein PLR41_18570, partial [Alphaproteobacteria bacterium]|nr:hypothetical protein [Alphaproteobacteria bacterium]
MTAAQAMLLPVGALLLIAVAAVLLARSRAALVLIYPAMLLACCAALILALRAVLAGDALIVAAFQTLNADRGVILLYDDNKVLQPRCVRNRQGNQDPNENVLISQTIVDQVTRTREAVLSSDATVDSRFQGAHSIIMQGIRSTMC